MSKKRNSRPYFARPVRCYSYPNEAEPGYFSGRLLDGITAAATALGTVTLLMYFLTF